MRSLRARLIFSHILPVLIVVPLIGLAAFALLRLQSSLSTVETGLQQELANLQEQARILAGAAGQLESVLTDPQAATEFVTSVNLELTNVTLVDGSGRIIASSDEETKTRVGEALAEESVRAILSGSGSLDVEVRDQSGRQLAEVAIPLLGDDSRVEGVLLLTQEVAAMQSQASNVSALLATVVLLLLVLGIALGLLLALRLSNSLSRVTTTIEGIAYGEQPATLPEHDVREVDALYQSVNELAGRLRTLEDARKRLLANLVHELGRPLGSIRAAVHALRNGADDDPALRTELLGGITAQIEHMQPLLDNLTSLHGQVLGTLELSRKPTPLAPWLQQTISLWRAAALEKGIIWKVDVPLNLPTVALDGDQMGRAVGNLLSNAVKFTPAGGTITVTAAVKSPQQAALTVADTGSGIAPIDQQRIFEPFQRGQSGRRFPQGVGLGLSIARDIVQAHGGSITLESAPGQGSRFTILLPLEQ